MNAFKLILEHVRDFICFSVPNVLNIILILNEYQILKYNKALFGNYFLKQLWKIVFKNSFWELFTDIL